MIDIERIMEIEEVKKEADRLMIAKVTKYENEIAKLSAKLENVENTIKKIKEIINDRETNNKTITR